MNEPQSDLKKQKKTALTVELTVYSMFLIVFGLDIYSWLHRFKRREDIPIYFQNYLSFYFMYLVVMSQEISYCNFTYYVKKRISALNEAILSEINRKPQMFLEKMGTKKTPNSKLLIGSDGDTLENYILAGQSYSSCAGTLISI